MAKYHNDPYIVPASDDRRRLDRHLANAFMYTTADTPLGTRITFTHPQAMHDLFEVVERRGGDAREFAAALFLERFREQDHPRDVRAALLTRYARAMHDMHVVDHHTIRESEVAHAGKFVSALITEMPQMILDWVEDMATGLASIALEPQPTEVIRGVLLSPSFDQRRAFVFWKLIAKSSRFPMCIFSDPCAAAEGTLFTEWQCRAFALMFTHAPDEVVERAVAYMCKEATRKYVLVYSKINELCYERLENASETERGNVFKSIVNHVTPHTRREYVAGLYDLAA